MFGDTDTSYQLMNQRPGLLMAMLSFHRPPVYHAGSLGARAIMSPPVSTGIFVSKMPGGPPMELMMLSSGRCQSCADQSIGGICGAKSNILRASVMSACDVLAASSGDRKSTR